MRNIFLIFILTFLGTNTANSKNLDSALGFMLGGDGGWSNVATFHEIKKCTLEYHQQFMGINLIVKYDFDKAIWKSAEAVDNGGQLYFTLNGQYGLQNLKGFDENGNDVTDGLLMFGLTGGDSNQILFPILVDIKRFEVALKDVMKKCKGVKSDY